MAGRHIEHVRIDSLKPALRNPKHHSDEDINKSIGRFGFVEPMILDERTGRMVAGHGRLNALRSLEEKGGPPPSGVKLDPSRAWLVPVVRGWASRSDQEADAYLLASNQLTIAGGWQTGELVQLLKELDAAKALDGVGFSQDELAKLLASVAPHAPSDGSEDEVPEPPEKPWVCRGDLFDLDGSRILCGDCRSFADVERLMAGQKISVAATSPPYASQRTYDETSGFKPIPPDAYVEWYRDVSANVLAHLAADGSYFVNIKEHCEDGQRSLYVKDLVIAHVREWGWRFVDEFCWRNTKNGVPGGWNNRFKNAWEPVFHFTRSNGIKFRPSAVSEKTDQAFDYSPHNNKAANGSGLLSGERADGLREGVARPSNVIEVAAAASADHSAAYPVGLPEFFVKAYSDEKDSIFDPFMGSGTTLIAAVKNGRRGFGTEISPAYTQVILERWERFTGKKATKVE